MSTSIHILKEEVELFSLTMLYKLGLHKNKGHWASNSDDILFKHLQSEILELSKALKDGDRENICSECADVANMAMMIHNNSVNSPKNNLKSEVNNAQFNSKGY